MTTGEKITKLRKDGGLTQEELAEKLNVTRQSVSRWESDSAFPETDKLVALSRLFNCTVDYLLKYDDKERAAESGSSVHTGLKDRYFEYKSKRTVKGVPLVHVNIGLGRTAKGIIAVGIKSVGVFSVGVLSLGVISVGLLALGLFAIASVGFGLILSACAISFGVLSVGAISVGVFSVGGVSIGLLAFGGCAVGGYSFGGFSYGGYVAIGNVAKGGIALGGKSAQGAIFSATSGYFEELKEAIYSAFDGLPSALSPLTNAFKRLFEAVLRGEITLG